MRRWSKTNGWVSWQQTFSKFINLAPDFHLFSVNCFRFPAQTSSLKSRDFFVKKNDGTFCFRSHASSPYRSSLCSSLQFHHPSKSAHFSHIIRRAIGLFPSFCPPLWRPFRSASIVVWGLWGILNPVRTSERVCEIESKNISHFNAHWACMKSDDVASSDEQYRNPPESQGRRWFGLCLRG